MDSRTYELTKDHIAEAVGPHGTLTFFRVAPVPGAAIRAQVDVRDRNVLDDLVGTLTNDLKLAEQQVSAGWKLYTGSIETHAQPGVPTHIIVAYQPETVGPDQTY